MEKSWHLVFWRGAIAIAFGLVAFAWPLVTIGALVLLFAAFAVIDGLLALALAARELRQTAVFRPLVYEGIVGLLAGLVALLAPALAYVGAAIVVSVWAVATGVLEIVAGFALREASADEGSLLIGGFASVGLGVALMIHPAAAPLALASLLGSYAVIFGVLLVSLAIRLRRPTFLIRRPR